MMDKVLHSSKKMDWRTPEEVLNLVREMGKIALDPCASPNKEHWFAEKNWTDFDKDSSDVLSVKGRAFINPPYGRDMVRWVGRYSWVAPEAILLAASRTDTKWFNEAWQTSDAYCFWKGRIKFVGAKDPAPFPSVLFYRGIYPHFFCSIFQDKGIVGTI